jgi:hypothetical protein
MIFSHRGHREHRENKIMYTVIPAEAGIQKVLFLATESTEDTEKNVL